MSPNADRSFFSEPVPLVPATPEAFWRMADSAKMAEEYRVDRNLRYLRIAPPEVLKRIFVQYRFFTHYYIADLALLVAKMPFGTLRTYLGHFLSEELGDGDPAGAHPRLYDDFLLSVGVAPDALDRPSPAALQSLDGIREALLARSWPYGVGLRGMGGECLCQVYLSSMHENFTQNPYIQSIGDRVAWKFWDIHTGDVDIHHRELTRSAISELLIAQPETLRDLAGGYDQSKQAWDRFWTGIFEDAQKGVLHESVH
jgi:hypothetical protein